MTDGRWSTEGAYPIAYSDPSPSKATPASDADVESPVVRDGLAVLPDGNETAGFIYAWSKGTFRDVFDFMHTCVHEQVDKAENNYAIELKSKKNMDGIERFHPLEDLAKERDASFINLLRGGL